MDRSADWINQAKRDLEKVEYDIAQGYFEWACFTAQQASEKAVKAVYQSKNQLARGHSVLKLLGGLSNFFAITEEMLHKARILDRYYIEGRYPNGFPQGMPADYFDKKIAREAQDAARKIVGFCADIIG